MPILHWEDLPPPVTVFRLAVSFTSMAMRLTGIKTTGAIGYCPALTLVIRHLYTSGGGDIGVIFDGAAGDTLVEDPPFITATVTADNPILFGSNANMRTNPLLRPLGGTGLYGIRI